MAAAAPARAVEEEGLAETDDVFHTLRRTESPGVQALQAVPCVRQVFRGGTLAIALEKRAGRDQVRTVGARRRQRGLFCRRKGVGELPLVVQDSRPFERVARLGGKDRRRQTKETGARAPERRLTAHIAIS
jgi:hypothetical protein